jgi:hypothetical protein
MDPCIKHCDLPLNRQRLSEMHSPKLYIPDFLIGLFSESIRPLRSEHLPPTPLASWIFTDSKSSRFNALVLKLFIFCA